jgi:hypothetical protein
MGISLQHNSFSYFWFSALADYKQTPCCGRKWRRHHSLPGKHLLGEDSVNADFLQFQAEMAEALRQRGHWGHPTFEPAPLYR